MQAFETTARIDDTGQLHLDQPLLVRNRRAKIVVLLDDQSDADEWIQAINSSPSFAFLHDSEEDIYTSKDGTPAS